jgi:type IV pilus assembly protein PilA
MMKNIKKKKGVTLIELIIVIAIIGILAAITVPKFASIQQDAKVKADIASAKIIADATMALIAKDGITETTRYATELPLATDIMNYLQNVPVAKAFKNGVFKVKIDDKDDVIVTVDKFKLYPIPDKDYPVAKKVDSPVAPPVAP